MTYPGRGGQQPAPYNAPAGQAPQPGITPGIPPVLRATEIIIVPGGTLEGIFTYSTNPGAAGTLIETASVEAAGVDQYGNNFVPGHASYASGFATSLNGGFIQFYTGSLAGGWTAAASIAIDAFGDMALLAAVGRAILTNNQTLDDGSGNMTVSAALACASLTVGGSSNTGSGNNGGVTSGPSGTVSSFPAAGPNHTHAEIHQHPF